jgi:hypothetical protein
MGIMGTSQSERKDCQIDTDRSNMGPRPIEYRPTCQRPRYAGQTWARKRQGSTRPKCCASRPRPKENPRFVVTHFCYSLAWSTRSVAGTQCGKVEQGQG